MVNHRLYIVIGIVTQYVGQFIHGRRPWHQRGYALLSNIEKDVKNGDEGCERENVQYRRQDVEQYGKP